MHGSFCDGPPARRPTSRIRASLHRTGELNPNSVRILDEGEESPAFDERSMARRRTPRPQLTICALDVFALERDVIQLVAVSVGTAEELGALGIPVEFQDPTRTGTPKFGPLSARLGDSLASSELHSEQVLIEREGTRQVADLDSDVGESKAHGLIDSGAACISDSPASGGSQHL